MTPIYAFLARAFTAAAVAPVLSSANYSLVDTGGGDSITLIGTGTSTATGVQFSRDSGATWVAGALSGTTSTTAAVVAPPMAAAPSSAGLVRLTSASGPSNALAIEFWSPAQITGIDSYFDSRKGVVVTGSSVTGWTEQTRADAGYVSDPVVQATLVANVFAGTKPAVRMSPAGTAGAKAQSVAKPTSRTFAARSDFVVAKWTSATSTATAYSGNPPLGFIGDTTGGVNYQFGASAGVLRKMVYTAGWQTFDRGSGLNDGQARLLGTTMDASFVHTTYVGTAQQGTTFTSAPSGSSGFSAIGGSYSGTVAYAEDGFVGDIGAAIVVAGVIAAGDLAKLNAWSQAGFGTP